MSLLAHLLSEVERQPYVLRRGRVSAFNGLVIEADGPDAGVGEVCEIVSGRLQEHLRAQVVGLKNGRTLLLPYDGVVGLSVGDEVRATGRTLDVPVGVEMLGRVVDAFCQPLDGLGAIREDVRYPLHAAAPNPLHRQEIDHVLETGVRVVDALLTLGRGQRIGIFAGSGVGKSSLLGMLARNVQADVVVLALIGERGREVGDFVRQSLGAEGLKRSVVVAATADQPALVRTHAVHAAHAIAEFFRDQGKSVLLVVDSITRFAMAQREIGLAVGEPPTFRGYTPSVFSWLPKIAERCGNHGRGSITAIYSVLVEGDDFNEPVTDHMRAILDGHIVLDRELAARGHYPAINVLGSVSRLVGRLASEDELSLAAQVRRSLALYEASRDMIELGAHQRGVNAELDQAVDVWPMLERVLRQPAQTVSSRPEALEHFAAALRPASSRAEVGHAR
ncbi:FliI/YscN family ATPase [Xanthomonas sacchari]|uniref:FliI/YscN family ATPase n=1 Tax=Xanthomonas TaxID=338 RepID=UPI00225E1095|nr:FliI/YscN family ATPase [Xanthomonas sacchari]MCW0436683.1 putative ATP synthase YscN [Xanthomonas sacchari]